MPKLYHTPAREQIFDDRTLSGFSCTTSAAGLISSLGILVIVSCIVVTGFGIYKNNFVDLRAVTTNTFSTTTQALVPQTPDEIKVLFVGDMMMDRSVRSLINRINSTAGLNGTQSSNPLRGFEYIFGPATTTFAAHDLVIGNLEGSISSNKSKLVLANNQSISGFQFTFATTTAVALKQAGIDVVSLANNHMMDFGQTAINETRSLLKQAGVQYFGSYYNSSEISTTSCPQIDFCVGLVGWNEFGHANDQRIIAEIARLRPTVQYLVVFPHWGVEYKNQPTTTQRALAQSWLNAGADAIIGAHPHIVQRIETFTTKDGRKAPIFYSLGNFIFDQYFSFDTTHGIGVSITFKKESGNKITSTPGGSTTNIASNATNTVTSRFNGYTPAYSIIPFSSIGHRVSIPTVENKAKFLKTVETISEIGVRNWVEFK